MLINRVALYARVSTTDKGQDTTNQLIALREYCAAQAWAITHEYIDEATGTNSDRTKFKAMLSDSSRRMFDAVVVWKLDRLSREGIGQTFQHIRRLLSNGVQFISYTEEHFRTNGP